ncbi:MAG: hypothetical protein MUO60_17055 [Clostridiaceae bacterium]|nr:hypothetical protein [Clostridiaceae bacterium]
MLNLHTHTIFSDGYHTPEELILSSIEDVVKILGISDHHSNGELVPGRDKIPADII